MILFESCLVCLIVHVRILFMICLQRYTEINNAYYVSHLAHWQTEIRVTAHTDNTVRRQGLSVLFKGTTAITTICKAETWPDRQSTCSYEMPCDIYLWPITIYVSFSDHTNSKILQNEIFLSSVFLCLVFYLLIFSFSVTALWLVHLFLLFNVIWFGFLLTVY